MPYKALARASVNIEIIEDIEQYEALIISTNGVILQPYDTSTTLIGTVLKNKVDITNRIEDVRWTKWNPSNDNLIECEEWNENHIGMSTIILTKEDVDGKSVFVFEARDKNGRLLCSSSISIVDINDLLASTNKPENPYVGQIWIDGSTDPATMYVWNGYKWVVTGSVGAIVKNLLRNTSFIGLDHWDIVGDTTLSFTPYSIEHLGHNFLKLNSDVLTDEDRGVSQSTTDIICPFGEYSFQMLFYSTNETETYSNNIMVNIYSVGKHTGEVLVYNKTLEAERRILRVFGVFEAMSDTDHFRVEILGESGSRYEFYIAELALYNTHNNYPWTINPSDIVAREYTQEDIWNILSNNGTVQGIFSRKDPETGQLEYYINANMIQAGKMKAEFMEMYGLKVLRKSDKKATLQITDNGDVLLNVNKLVITSGDTEMNVEQEISAEGMKSKVENIITDEDGEVNKQIVSIAQQAAGGFSQEVLDQITGAMSSFSQTLEDITTRVENAEGDLSEVEQTADKIEWLIKSGESESSMELTDKLYSLTTEKAMISAKEIELNGSININDGTFTVDTEGNMIANSGKFIGDISGSTITGTEITGGTIISPNIYSQAIYDEDGNLLLDKDGQPIIPKFSLTSDGTVTAYNAIIHGTVAGGIVEGEVFQSANGKFRVLANGTLECQEANIKGDITAGSTITGATVKGGEIIGTTIKNESETFTVDSDGTVTGATIISSDIKGGTIGIGGTDYSAFTVDNNGNCNISRGSIKIGDNFEVLNDGTLTANNGNFTGNIDGSSISGGSINIGNGQFVVNSDGHLIAKSAEIDAEMSATTGKIAGFTIADNTLTATNVGINSTNATSAIAFWAGSDTASNAPFRVTNAGKLSASNVEITGGILQIGEKFKVENDGSLYATNGSFSGDISGSTITGGSISGTSINVNNKFTVDSNGNLTATNADITGIVESKEGHIGGFDINEYTLIGTGVGLGSSTSGTMAFWAGSNTASSAPFRVDHSGNLTSTSGNIGGYTIEEYKLTNGTVGMCSNSDVEWAFWAGAQYGIDAPFHVGHDGSLYATKANMSGTITGATINIGPVDTNDDGEVDYYNFSVKSNGNTKIGGPSAVTIDNYARAKCEINSYGTIYSCATNYDNLYTKISEGNITCSGNNGTTTIIQGSITATSGNFNGSITGSNIIGSTFSSANDTFQVYDDGAVSTNDISISNEVSAFTVSAEKLNVSWYDRCLTRDVKVTINESHIYPAVGELEGGEVELDESYFYYGATFRSVEDLMQVAPRNLNGYTLNIHLGSSLTSNTVFNGFNNGTVKIHMNNYNIKGYLALIGRAEYYVYGYDSSHTNQNTQIGRIKPNNGYNYDGNYFAVYCSANKVNLYDLDIYKGNNTANTQRGIAFAHGCIAYVQNIKAVNQPANLVRAQATSHVYVASSRGKTSSQSFQATSGAIVQLNNSSDIKQANKDGYTQASDNVYMNGNGKVFYDDVTWDNTAQTGDNDNTNTITTVTKTITIKSDYGDSYRTSGSYSGTWKKDNTVRAGRWATSYGSNTGCWFFGNDIYNILHSSKNEITSVKIKITRQSGGYGSAINHYLRIHKHEKRPGSPSLISSDIFSKSFTLAVGSSITLSLTSSEINAIISNNAKGFGLYTSSTDQTYYTVCSGSATVTIKYKTTEND